MGRKKKNINLVSLENDMSHDILYDKYEVGKYKLDNIHLSPTLEIGIRLKVLRQMTGLTLEEFGQKFKITPSMCGRYERGETRMRQDTCWAVITQLFVEFNISCLLKWLLRGEGNGPVYIKSKEASLTELMEGDDHSTEAQILVLAQLYKNINSEKIMLCVVRDRFMNTLFSKSTLVGGVIIPLNNVDELRKINNHYCILETKKNKQFVRIVTYDVKTNCLSVNSGNPVRSSIFSINNLNVIAKVSMILHNPEYNDEEDVVYEQDELASSFDD